MVITAAITVPYRHRLIFSDRQLGLTEHLDALMTASAFINSSSSNSSSTAPTRAQQQYSAVRAKLACIKTLAGGISSR
jgi:hypothetical protein